MTALESVAAGDAELTARIAAIRNQNADGTYVTTDKLEVVTSKLQRLVAVGPVSGLIPPAAAPPESIHKGLTPNRKPPRAHSASRCACAFCVASFPRDVANEHARRRPPRARLNRSRARCCGD